MKTTISIIEALMFNLLPPELAAHLLAFLKNLIPLFGLVGVRVSLYIIIGLQKANNIFIQSLRNEELGWKLSFLKQD